MTDLRAAWVEANREVRPLHDRAIVLGYNVGVRHHRRARVRAILMGHRSRWLGDSMRMVVSVEEVLHPGLVLKPDGRHEKTRQRGTQAHLWRVLGQMRIIAAVMTAPPISHSRAACARLAMGAITAIPITMTSSPIIVSSNLAVLPTGATRGRGDSVSRCDRQHSSALTARQRRSDDGRCT
jgi:hypothetical protein